MQKHIGIIRKAIFFLSLFFLVWACGDKAEPPKSTPVVVRKSIPKKRKSIAKKPRASKPVASKKAKKPKRSKPEPGTATDLSTAKPIKKNIKKKKYPKNQKSQFLLIHENLHLKFPNY